MDIIEMIKEKSCTPDLSPRSKDECLKNLSRLLSINAGGFSEEELKQYPNIKYYGTGVLDWLDGKISFASNWITLGKYLAPFFGRSKIAPWILCGARVDEKRNLIDVRGIDDLLQCPSCGGDLSNDKREYVCLACKMRYSIEDGIIDMRMG